MNSRLTKLARDMRKNPTKAEAILWNRIRSRQLGGVKFRRQQPIDRYIVDLVSFEKQIVIELDGGQHAMDKDKDQERDRVLTDKSFTVLRFWNNDIIENIEGELEAIRQKCL